MEASATPPWRLSREGEEYMTAIATIAFVHAMATPALAGAGAAARHTQCSSRAHSGTQRAQQQRAPAVMATWPSRLNHPVIQDAKM